MNHSLRSRRPTGDPNALQLVTDPGRVFQFLEDAAHFPGGHAPGMVAPANEAEIAAAVAAAQAILPIGAQSSLTGGGTPMGDIVLTTARLNQIERVDSGSVRVQAGVTLAALEDRLRDERLFYPPAPTFTGAFIGGTIATNAAGAATFKYGTTRDFVDAITVVLPDGDVLDIDRGRTRAHPDGYFDLELTRGRVRVPVPRYLMPRVAKLSAGYFAAPGMDLIDLFIGSEGTLGIVTAATLRVCPRPAVCLAFVPFDDRARALRFVSRLRDESIRTRQSRDPLGVDAAAIEHMDERCLALLLEDGADRAAGIPIAASTKIALLVTMEVPSEPNLGGFLNLLNDEYCAMLSSSDDLDRVIVALPGDRSRAAQLVALREAVPAAVNRRIGDAQRLADPRIEKTAADMIVPFEHFEELLTFYADEFARRGLDAAIWGHISDGNVHPNVIPRSFADVESGRDAILAFGREAIRLGGAPLAEHGVGRSVLKQRLLRELYGDDGIQQMRKVKAAIDPAWKLSRGVLFPPATNSSF